ncbi:hypothetical protein GYMLUDRAFT_59146 [Collybiopsis luxurians FD-317 M1]|uniref:Unplaced genomic scaffold GYMLUscaffold_24, whole genome shotgun sequence n=1 Tax=Collybiopsis luxurians FD-317 M1 TaxID=944289 RepID=A0A0D0BZA4_9AGAR|nr:hypothetical protein GYMLUDRAFT_59146 [Collybiopsis luxurians FD-317 M1]
MTRNPNPSGTGIGHNRIAQAGATSHGCSTHESQTLSESNSEKSWRVHPQLKAVIHDNGNCQICVAYVRHMMAEANEPALVKTLAELLGAQAKRCKPKCPHKMTITTQKKEIAELENRVAVEKELFDMCIACRERENKELKECLYKAHRETSWYQNRVEELAVERELLVFDG